MRNSTKAILNGGLAVVATGGLAASVYFALTLWTAGFGAMIAGPVSGVISFAPALALFLTLAFVAAAIKYGVDAYFDAKTGNGAASTEQAFPDIFETALAKGRALENAKLPVFKLAAAAAQQGNSADVLATLKAVKAGSDHCFVSPVVVVNPLIAHNGAISALSAEYAMETNPMFSSSSHS